MFCKLFIPAVLVLAAQSAQADVVISSGSTQNMSCSAGVCAPTAADAVLSIDDLQTLMQSQDVKVVTGSGAVNIVVADAFSITHTLTLDATQSVTIEATVTAINSGLAIVTNDGGSGGDLVFLGNGRGDIHQGSTLAIDGNAYTLVFGMKGLVAAAKHDRFIALGHSFRAPNKEYPRAPIASFSGILEGLGNTIAALQISSADTNANGIGLFGTTVVDGSDVPELRDLGLPSVVIDTVSSTGPVGALAGLNAGTIVNCWSDGLIYDHQSSAGGLVGNNAGDISRSRSAMSIPGYAGSQWVGDLVGYNTGSIDQSFTTGGVSTFQNAGGLVGGNEGGTIANSYSKASAEGQDEAVVGGLVGVNDNSAVPGFRNSYAAGPVGGSGSSLTTGGFVGIDDNGTGVDAYWVMSRRTISDPSQGAGNVANDPGITGLKGPQIKSALPSGFDPAVWGQAHGINSGYPYLLANPPQ
jgi:hypothetical protein